MLDRVEGFVKACEELWELIERHRERLPWLIKVHGYAYELALFIFGSASAFIRDLISKTPSLSHLARASLLGLHAVMYQVVVSFCCYW